MLVYATNKTGFIEDVHSGSIEDIILQDVQRHLGHNVSSSEVRSWQNSLRFMSAIVSDNSIPNDSGIAIEYKIPVTNNRIDFIITGQNESKKDAIVIIELKQWENVSPTDKDGIVRTYVGQAERELTHPSYQAWTYATLLEDYSEVVQDKDIVLKPCAYLHNCSDHDVINAPFYSEHTEKAPAFLKNDANELASFIKRYIKHGDSAKIMYQIDNGRIRPSKALADCLESLLEGNQDFLMIDDQKLVYETALKLAKESTVKNKNILIVEGGPGTGKSVVAINLLVALTKKKMLTQYVTKNAAPRTVYAAKLKKSFRKSHVDNLFKGSGSYTSSNANEFDALLVDEAHRLNAKSGMFQHLGENQIKELIHASKFTTFFIDENQKVTFKDIGEKEALKEWARKEGANVHSMELKSQFRCNGSDGYIAWLDNSLQVHATANRTLQDINYDFRVFDSPSELKNAIFDKNKASNKARLVAGYCWNWVSKKDATLFDINFEEYNFAMKWNLASDGNLWIVNPESVSEVGCIHTCQGLELDYIGVIIGSDLIVRDNKVITDPSQRAKTDSSIKGFKKLHKKDPESALKKAEEIIKNTYRTLMTRGTKGCYIFCTDSETREYFNNLLGREIKEFIEPKAKPSVSIHYTSKANTTNEVFEPSSTSNLKKITLELTSILKIEGLSFDDSNQVSKAVEELLTTLFFQKSEMLTDQATNKDDIQKIIENVLGKHLPRTLTLLQFKKSCDLAYNYILNFKAVYN